MANGTAAPRCAALIGPYLSGKTTLLEALLHASGATTRRGSVRDGNSVGDHTPEARARQMSTELNVANATFLGDPWTILDCQVQSSCSTRRKELCWRATSPWLSSSPRSSGR